VTTLAAGWAGREGFRVDGSVVGYMGGLTVEGCSGRQQQDGTNKGCQTATELGCKRGERGL
jgi:hypothetical protein